MQAALQPAYILHRRAYRETSLILDVLTLDSGRIACIAKGAMQGKRGKGALLQALQPLHVALSGKSELLTLIRCEAASSALFLQGKSLYCCYYVNELLLRLLPEREPVPRIFAYYAETLAALGEEKTANIETVLRCFEVRLLKELGLAPDYRFDVMGNPIAADAIYQWHRDGNFVRVAGPASNFTYHGATLLALHSLIDARRELASGERREAKRLMRMQIDSALNGKRLNSRQFFETPVSKP